jgi:hypothetical protein
MDEHRIARIRASRGGGAEEAAVAEQVETQDAGVSDAMGSTPAAGDDTPGEEIADTGENQAEGASTQEPPEDSVPQPAAASNADESGLEETRKREGLS